MGVELILGMEEVINYLKQLEAENKKLKEDIEKAWDQRGDKWRKARIKNLEAENKKLKEQNDCLQRQIESVCKANDELKEKLTTSQYQYDMAIQIDNKEIASLKEEIKELKEEEEMKLSAVEALKFMEKVWDEEEKEWVDEELEHYKESDIDYYIDAARKVVLKDGRTLKTNDDWLDESDSDEEEEEDKYEKDPEWRKAYGFTVKRGEYRICVAGGGDHWEDYVITKNKCFIENSGGRINVNTFISHEETNHIRDIPLGVDMFILDEGERDMKEFIQENYEEEIMNYVETDEDDYEEPDSP